MLLKLGIVRFFILSVMLLFSIMKFGEAMPFSDAIYDTYEDITSPGWHRYGAYVADTFFQNKLIGITIEKCDVVDDTRPTVDSYAYAISILQLTNEHPFSVKKIMIASEWDSIEITANKVNRSEGLDFITDRILYFTDPGKVNRVILSVDSKMLIRITSTNNVVYDFYPSLLYISYAKKVANWARR